MTQSARPPERWGEIPEEQLAYAAVMRFLGRAGLLILLATFLVYMLGVVPPHVPTAHLPHWWSLPAKHYVERTGLPPGWSWLRVVDKGDYMNFVGIAVLGSVALCSYLVLVPFLAVKRRYFFLGLAVAEVMVLVLAASGLITSGHN